MDDISLIRLHGGATKLATLLGYANQKAGVQRVQNWTTRGPIPAEVKLEHPHIFLRHLINEAKQGRQVCAIVGGRSASKSNNNS